MTQTRSVWQRELRIEDDSRRKLRREIDPLIHAALIARGYTEDRAPQGRIALDGSNIMVPSQAYVNAFGTTFDALTSKTTFDVTDHDKTLIRGSIGLLKIGGFMTARLALAGNRYFQGVQKERNTDKKIHMGRIGEEDFNHILEDIRAQTILGYSASDEPRPVAEVFAELEALSDSRYVDRRAHFESIADIGDTDIQVDIAETFEERDRVSNGKMRRHRYGLGKAFTMLATQPLEKGSLTMGLHYSSGPRLSEMKLTSVIHGTTFTPDEQEALYQEAIRSFQDPRYNRFGDAVIRNLRALADPESDTIRLG